MESIRDIIGQLFQNLWFEDVARFVVAVVILVLVYDLWFFIRRYRALGNPHLDTKKSPVRLDTSHPIQNRLKKDLSKISHEIYWVIKPGLVKAGLLTVLASSIIGIFVFHYFFTRPYIVFQSPAEEQAWNDQTQPITIVFDKPVQKDKIEFNISTDTPGKLVWIPAFSGLPSNLQMYREFRFYPRQTILPESEVVVYIVGIKNITNTDGNHEAAIEFTPPQIPEIKFFSVEDAQEEIPVDLEAFIEFSVGSGPYIDWEFNFDPKVEFKIIKPSADNWKIVFPSGLEQNTTYNLTIGRTIVEIDLETEEELSRFEFEIVDKRSFATVKTPFIEKISPTGKSVKPSSDISITFDMAMNEQSVVDNFSIVPDVDGTFSWEKENITLKFSPTSALEKDTEYMITISGEAEAVNGGKTLKTLEHTFATLGALKVFTISPANNTSDIDPGNSITFEFDQEVDRESAQSNFTISPNVSGNFSWSGNKLIFKPSSLNFNTTYTASLAKGIASKYGDSSNKSYSTKFTTRSETFILGVPWYPQQEAFTCNVATTRMVLEYKGTTLAEATIKNTIGVQPPFAGSTGGDPYKGFVNGYGTYWTPISAYISNYRTNVIKQGWNLTDMLKEVRNGNPSIIWWQNQWSEWYWKEWTTPDGGTVGGLNGMHSEVVVGYTGAIDNPTTIITQDPWRGTRYYPTSTFKDVWKRSFNNTAIVVY